MLADVLWGDDLPARPDNQVGVLVSRLRGVLGGDRLPRHDAGYALVPDWLDLRELDEGIAAAERSVAAGDALAARLAATMALDLVRGPLLPEEPRRGSTGPRQAVDRSVAATRLLAAEAALVSGDPAGAAALAAGGLDHDPYDEAALRVRSCAATSRSAGRPRRWPPTPTCGTRLTEDLGVSPAAETEALHTEMLWRAGARAARASTRPAAPERWDPLVQRARAELAAADFDAARRDADEAVRRGAGASALEVAGWVAYYDRDFPTRPAPRRAGRPHGVGRRAAHERPHPGRAGPALAGRPGRAPSATSRRRCRAPSPGVRGTGEVWLGALRMHQGRFAEAIDLSTRGAVDAAAMRHPFVIPHAHVGPRPCARRARSCRRRPRGAGVASTCILDELGPAGRPLPAGARQPLGLDPRGHRTDRRGARRHRRALDTAGRFTEPRHHALFDLALAAVEAEDAATARAWLAQVEVPPDDAGAMAWHQRHRQHLLEARIALIEDDPATAAPLADVRARRRRPPRRARGRWPRPRWWQHLAAAMAGIAR